MQPILDTANQQIERGLIVDFEARKVKRLNSVVPVEVRIALVDCVGEDFGVPSLSFMVNEILVGKVSVRNKQPLVSSFCATGK